MDTMRVLVLCLPRAWGLEAVQRVATPNPSPSSPALVILTSESRGLEPGPPACKRAADSASDVASKCRVHLVVLMLGWCWDRCRTFWRTGPFVPNHAPGPYCWFTRQDNTQSRKMTIAKAVLVITRPISFD